MFECSGGEGEDLCVYLCMCVHFVWSLCVFLIFLFCVHVCDVLNHTLKILSLSWFSSFHFSFFFYTYSLFIHLLAFIYFLLHTLIYSFIFHFFYSSWFNISPSTCIPGKCNTWLCFPYRGMEDACHWGCVLCLRGLLYPPRMFSSQLKTQTQWCPGSPIFLRWGSQIILSRVWSSPILFTELCSLL